MWAVNGLEIKMIEGDYGVSLPITVCGAELLVNDVMKITIKDRVNGKEILSKIFNTFYPAPDMQSENKNNTFDLIFTKDDSDKLKTGAYVYILDWYQNNVFMCNIVPSAPFRVVDKA